MSLLQAKILAQKVQKSLAIHWKTIKQWKNCTLEVVNSFWEGGAKWNFILTDNKIGIEGVRALGDALLTNSVLSTLDLSCIYMNYFCCCCLNLLIGIWWTANSLRSEGAVVIAEVLKTNTSLVSLNLSCYWGLFYLWLDFCRLI